MYRTAIGLTVSSAMLGCVATNYWWRPSGIDVFPSWATSQHGGAPVALAAASVVAGGLAGVAGLIR